jgi:hypothetical protein
VSSAAVQTREAIPLMQGFAERTGLGCDRPEKRYLWTDAFAVCNYLAIARETGEKRYLDLALGLVDRVHHVLGRHRPDDVRRGWISGLPDGEGEAHPTHSGLRIGKPLPERKPTETLDEDLEWDRDGQYFHYLTQWMHALDQAARWTTQPCLNAWARELAETAYRAFVWWPGGRLPRLYWKMSIDLSRPLVASMGQHDPLDGLVACAELRSSATSLGQGAKTAELSQAEADFSVMIARQALPTSDPLGLGGLLLGACRIAQLVKRGTFAGDDLLDDVVAAARSGLSDYARQNVSGRPAERRLAFRELGLAIGLFGIQQAPDRDRFESLTPYVALAAELQSFWLEPRHRSARTWTEHRDINEVMLATSLLPDGYLVSQPV